jgi:hypothetical protein
LEGLEDFVCSIGPRLTRLPEKWISGHVRLTYGVPILLLVLRRILMPLTSRFPGTGVPIGLRNRLSRIGWVRRARLIGRARLATVGVFRIANLRPNGHREILQFLPNQTQFVDDFFSYLVFHIGPPSHSTATAHKSWLTRKPEKWRWKEPRRAYRRATVTWPVSLNRKSFNR